MTLYTNLFICLLLIPPDKNLNCIKIAFYYHGLHTPPLSNSMKLSHAREATQDGRVMVERSDRLWPTGEGIASCLDFSNENELES